jgi:hypothetical protein
MVIEKIRDTQQLKVTLDESVGRDSTPLAIFQEDTSNMFLVERVNSDAIKLTRELSEKFGRLLHLH